MTTTRNNQFGLALKLILFLIAVEVASAISVLTASAGSFPPTAITESGLVIGTMTDGVNEFLGIPYAAPPVGVLRWSPPKPYGFFPRFFLKATEFGNECPQFDFSGVNIIGSENCLFLNVYSPAAPPGRRLPVMVWIHGGGNATGSSDPYDPTRLVKKGVIVVTINYRIGFLGFFAESAIDAEGHLNGNYGLMDQQFALKWVRRNIEAFGGDRDRVTIFGESAGGQNVYSQLASPPAAGLFSRAIAESGAYFNFQDYYPFIVTLTTAETTGTFFVPSGNETASNLGCSKATLPETASCLRGLPASTLVSEQPGDLFPFVDGTLLTQTPDSAFAVGQFNRVPVISGGNHDEWRLFVFFDFNFLGIPLATETDYEAAVNATFVGFGSTFGYDYIYGPSGLYLLVNYPITPPIPSDPSPSPGIALGASGTDAFFNCPELNVVKLLSQYVTTYAYEFNDENAPPAQSSWGASLNFPMGAYHTAELQYLFTGDFFGYPIGPLSPKQEQLSDAMISYWTRFAKTGNPNSFGEPVWSPYSALTDEFQSLIPPTPVVETTFDSEHFCSSFWNTF